MKKKTIILLVIIVLIIVGAFFIRPSVINSPVHTSSFDAKNATYLIDNTRITLVNGKSEIPAAPNSASKITTQYFGNEAVGDLTGDGLPDTAFLITQNSGGTGTFYYAVVAIKTTNGHKITNAFFIGDRIAPQSTNINTSALELYVNYAERKPGESMSAHPSVGATKILRVTKDNRLVGLMEK